MRFKAGKFCGIPCLCVPARKWTAAWDRRTNGISSASRPRSSRSSRRLTAGLGYHHHQRVLRRSRAGALERCPGRHCNPLDPG